MKGCVLRNGFELSLVPNCEKNKKKQGHAFLHLVIKVKFEAAVPPPTAQSGEIFTVAAELKV